MTCRKEIVGKRPALFEKTENNIWTDPYIQQRMLEAHLDPGTDGASRREGSIRTTVEFIAEQAKPGGRLLDLGCGPGLYASLLRDRGYAVTGIDFNRASIEYARARRSDVTYLQGDYITGYPAGRFDTVILIYCDLGTHSDAERDRLLGHVYHSLETGGKLVFDVFTEGIVRDRQEGKNWEYAPEGGFWSPGEYLLLSETFHYPGERAFAYQYNLLTATESKHFVVWDRYYSGEEITAVLRKAGFGSVAIFNNLLSGNNFTSGSEMFVVAEK